MLVPAPWYGWYPYERERARAPNDGDGMSFDPTTDAMNAAAEHLDSVMFGVDRTIIMHAPVSRLGLCARDLRSMTLDEIESAMVGAIPWLNVPDELPSPVNAYGGLQAWLPPWLIEHDEGAGLRVAPGDESTEKRP